MKDKLMVAAVLIVALVAVTAWQVVLREREKHAKESAEAAEKKKQSDETARQQRILSDARSVVAQCELRKDGSIRLLGKAMLWDLADGSNPKLANELLPNGLRATDEDSRITVFLITERLAVRRTTYGGPAPYRGGASDLLRESLAKAGVKQPPREPSGIPGYRMDLKVCVVSWPEKKPLGCTTITGEEPPASVYLDKDAREYRHNSLGPLLRWLTSLPRDQVSQLFLKWTTTRRTRS
jgi:hypothetical protein